MLTLWDDFFFSLTGFEPPKQTDRERRDRFQSRHEIHGGHILFGASNGWLRWWFIAL
jgi:hypothetical protein